MIVVKLGGNGDLDVDSACQDVAQLVGRGEQAVVVHGGSAETNRLSELLGHPPRFVTSVSGHVSRYTDRETLEIFAMVTAGRINKAMVERLQQLGVNALGLSGLDGRLLQGRRKSALKIIQDGRKMVLRGDHTGTIEQVNSGLLAILLDCGYTPVVAPLAISPEGEALNVDADRAAAAIAVALQAQTLVILSNVPGLLRTFPDESSLIPRIEAGAVREYLDRYAHGRMKRKMLGSLDAVQGGVGQVVIADGRVDAPLQRALNGAGTVIR